jgi:phosphate transport system substrate-binding protein
MTPAGLSHILSVVAVLAVVSPPALAQHATGAGASFPAPVYTRWAAEYYAATGAQINYQTIGSSAGVRQIRADTVDFGASDIAVAEDVRTRDGLFQFPVVIGGVVPVVNLPGVGAGELTLTGPVLADMFFGNISRWDDPAVAALNPHVALPALAVTLVLRADGSGTTNVFTDYLSRVSPRWADEVGRGNVVRWPAAIAARSTGAKGNAGVAGVVQQWPGALGYVEYAYAHKNGLPHAALKNADGAVVQPDEESFQAAARGADWHASLTQSLTDIRGAAAWPITTTTYIVVRDKTAKPKETAAALRFVDWAFTNGDGTARELGYVPFPEDVKALIRRSWRELLDAAGTPLLCLQPIAGVDSPACPPPGMAR